MNRNLIAINTASLRADEAVWRAVTVKKLLPLLADQHLIGTAKEYALRYLKRDRTIYAANDKNTIPTYKGQKCFRIPDEIHDDFISNWKNSEYLFISIEGTDAALTVIAVFAESAKSSFDQISSRDATLRLNVFDLPPIRATSVTSPELRSAIYKWLGDEHSDLFSINAHRFLNSTHILTSLFAHIGSISSKESVHFIDRIRIIGDHFRKWMEPRIKSIEKDHHDLWGHVYGERISFIDGGMSRIIGLPSVEPMGIRVGTYTVIPGEERAEEREHWSMDSAVIGDILSDRSIIEDQDYKTDSKRLQEAARYILEPLSLLTHSKKIPLPYICLLHGPLQNQFSQYDELRPAYIPGVDADFLAARGIEKQDIVNDLRDIATTQSGKQLWNSAMAVYAFIMRRINEVDIPMLGVVERAASKAMIHTSLKNLVDDGVITRQTSSRVRSEIMQLDVDDQIVFGCLLKPGEYIEPMEVTKNPANRANDRWRPLMPQIPKIFSTVLKCGEDAYPFRVEFNRRFADDKIQEVMKLVYHTSLLLPRYAFPVGIDIVDKFAKIPDWMSKGISSHLAANVFRYCLQEGDVRTLRLMRTLLSRSPRDFFFRPKA